MKLGNDQDFIFHVAPGGVSKIDTEAKYSRVKERAKPSESQITLLYQKNTENKKSFLNSEEVYGSVFIITRWNFHA